ncbi:hypothetical protein Syun_018476 [Stephania yunnanensis]|uniref:Uncharacterized protein n=1 Tax=Stephania yunnanensis TaxID=152371 RepID=A0AAP0ISF9_9MAGN
MVARSADIGQVRRKQCYGSEELGGSEADAADGGSSETGVRPGEQPHRQMTQRLRRPTVAADREVAWL